MTTPVSFFSVNGLSNVSLDVTRREVTRAVQERGADDEAAAAASADQPMMPYSMRTREEGGVELSPQEMFEKGCVVFPALVLDARGIGTGSEERGALSRAFSVTIFA